MELTIWTAVCSTDLWIFWTTFTCVFCNSNREIKSNNFPKKVPPCWRISNFFMYQVDTTWNFQKDFHSLFHWSQYFVILVPCEYFKCKTIDSSMSANILYDVLSYLKNLTSGSKSFPRQKVMDGFYFILYILYSVSSRRYVFFCYLFFILFCFGWFKD